MENHKKLKNSGNEFGNKLETQAFQTNQSFPTIVDAIQVKETVTFGKQLVAKKDITVGNIVMVSTAFASVEYLSSIRDSSCFQCGKQFVAAKEIRCPHCINVRFCSRKCSLSRVHRIKCNQMFNQDDCETVRLVLEIIDKTSTFSLLHMSYVFFIAKNFCFSKFIANYPQIFHSFGGFFSFIHEHLSYLITFSMCFNRVPIVLTTNASIFILISFNFSMVMVRKYRKVE